MPELNEALKNYTGGLTSGGAIVASDSITAAKRDLFKTMDKSSQPLPPLVFLQVLHMAYPQFAEKAEQGGVNNRMLMNVGQSLLDVYNKNHQGCLHQLGTRTVQHKHLHLQGLWASIFGENLMFQ